MAYSPLPAFGKAAARQATTGLQAYQEVEDLEKSLFRKIGDPVLSGVSKVANVFDLPGSSVRDLIQSAVSGKWHNPIDQWATPTQGKNRVYGRDILTSLGVKKNKETGISGWFDDPMEAVRDIGGFAVDVGTDPFFFASGPSVAAVKGVGRFGGRLAGAITPNFIQAPVKAAVRRGRLLGNQLFDPAVMGRKTAEVQEAARGLHAQKAANRQQGLSEYLPMLRRIEDEKLLSPEHGQMLRDVLENARTPVRDPISGDVVREPATPFFTTESSPPGTVMIPGDVMMQPVRNPADVPDLFKEITDRVRTLNETNLTDMQALGARRKELEDIIEYASRRMGADFQEKLAQSRQLGGDKRPLGTTDPADVGRSKVYKGFEGGTNAVNKVLSNPEWEQVIEAAGSRSAAVREITNRISQDYAHEIRPLYSVEKQVPGSADPFIQTKDRYKELAETIVDYHKELRETKGLFTNHPLVDAAEGHIAARNQIAAMNTLYDVLANPKVHLGSKDWQAGKLGQGTTIGDVVHSMDNLSKAKAVEEVARRMGVRLPSLDDIANAANPTIAAQLKRIRKDTLNVVRNTTIRKDVADDLTQLYTGWKVPEEVGTLGKFWRSYSSLFKAGVLTWPARYVRDMVSGLARNWENKMFDPKSFKEAHKITQGRTVEGLQDIPAVKAWLQRTNRPLNDENATKAIQEMYAANKASDVFQNTDLPIPEAGMAKAEEYLDMLPGRKQPSVKEWMKSFAGRTPGTSLNPLEVRGVYRKDGTIRHQSKFGPAVWGDTAGKYADDVNRLAPFINQLRKGVDPAEAMRKIDHAQVNYSPSNFTKTDQFLKQIFPFYSFAKAQIPYVAKELTTNPGGRLGQVLRAQNEATGDPEQFLPEHVAETASIPLGEAKDGSQRFLGGLGLMHEDPLQFAGGDLQSILGEIGSRTHPGIKGPLEYAFDKSLFRKDMMLDELDPTMGRIATNLGLMEPTASGRAKPLGGKLTEHVVANSPLARILTTARTLGDTRKDPVSKATNLLTGVRVTDVPQYQREGILRDLANQQAKSLGARTFSRTYFSKEQLAEAEKIDPAAAEQMRAFNELQALISNVAKEKKKAKKGKDTANVAGR